MSVEIITKEDLQTFRKELLRDIESLLGEKSKSQGEWLKTSEVRKLLQISPGTLSSLRTSGRLRYSKIGGTYYYRKQDIQNMLTKANQP